MASMPFWSEGEELQRGTARAHFAALPLLMKIVLTFSARAKVAWLMCDCSRMCLIASGAEAPRASGN